MIAVIVAVCISLSGGIKENVYKRESIEFNHVIYFESPIFWHFLDFKSLQKFILLLNLYKIFFLLLGFK